MRRLIMVTGMLVALAAAASTSVLSMEEQRGAIPGGMAVPDAPKAQEQDPATTTPSRTEGTEIRIPGLGKIGTLPKMDFGLDLLYGAAEDTNKAPNLPDSQNSDDQKDLMIHGSVKHRF